MVTRNAIFFFYAFFTSYFRFLDNDQNSGESEIDQNAISSISKFKEESDAEKLSIRPKIRSKRKRQLNKSMYKTEDSYDDSRNDPDFNFEDFLPRSRNRKDKSVDNTKNQANEYRKVTKAPTYIPSERLL